MKKVLLCMVMSAAVVGLPAACLAQAAPSASPGALKPVVTLSVASYDDLMANLDLIGTLIAPPGQPKADLRAMVEGQLAQLSGGQGVAGLGIDSKRPWGVTVQTDGNAKFAAVAFVPVTDIKKLLGAISPMVGQGKDVGGGVQQFSAPGPGGKSVFVKQQSGWAFVADSAENLASAPADPVKAMGGLDKKYAVGVHAWFQNIPLQIRQGAIMAMKMPLQFGMQKMPGESNEDFAIRKGLATQGVDQIAETLNGLDEFEFGLIVEQSAKSIAVNMEATAAKGSKLAAQFATMKQAKTDFAGFDWPGAAVTANWAGTLSDSDVAQAKKNLATFRSKALAELKKESLTPEQSQLATKLVADLFDVLEKTIETKKADAGAVLLLDSSSAVFVAGSAIAEGKKLENSLKQLVAEVQKESPDLGQMLKLDAETYQGVRFHTLTAPTPDPNAAKFLGPNVEAVVGIGDQALYLAGGKNAAATLKQVMDKSKAAPGKEVAPFRLVVAATPILKFAQEAVEGPPKQILGQLATAVSQAAGKDRVTLTSKANAAGNGANVRLEFEEGALKSIAAVVMQLSPQGGRAAPGNPDTQPAAPAGEDNPF